MVTACCTTLPSTMVSMTSRRLAFFWNGYSPGFRSELAFSASTPPMNSPRIDVDHAFALQQVGDVAHAGARAGC